MIRVLKNFQRLCALMLVIAATLLVYWPAQRNGFVWDDSALVQRDPLIRSWRLIPEGFRHFLFLDATASNFYRPLQRLSFTLDYALWDRSARGWHLTSIYVHLAAALALFALAEKWLRSIAWAAAVALLWAIHPLHTSAVTYIAGRADPLQAFFGFTALALASRTLGTDRRTLALTLGASACFLGALLSKESGVAALLVWLVVLAWQRVPARVWGKWLACAAVVLAIYGGLRLSAESTPPPISEPTPLAVRPILASRAVAEYAGLILAPVNLRMERDVSSGVGLPQERAANAQRREWQTLLGMVLIAALCGWWFWAKRRAPGSALLLLAALVAYLPVSNLFALNASVAEHWLYVPLAFLFIAAALSLRTLPLRPGWLVMLLLPWALWLGARTWQRQGDWRDQRTFLTRTIEAGGDTARMRVNLGQLESSEGRDEVALEEFSRALQRAPEQAFALLGAAAVHIRLRQFDQAMPLLAEAEKSALLRAEAQHLRAAIERLKTGVDTSAQLRAAAENAPRHWPSWRRYFAELIRTNQQERALRELRAFLEQQPFRAESWAMLADLLAQKRDYTRAIAAFREAIRRDVHDASSRARMAILERTPPE